MSEEVLNKVVEWFVIKKLIGQTDQIDAVVRVACRYESPYSGSYSNLRAYLSFIYYTGLKRLNRVRELCSLITAIVNALEDVPILTKKYGDCYQCLLCRSMRLDMWQHLVKTHKQVVDRYVEYVKEKIG